MAEEESVRVRGSDEIGVEAGQARQAGGQRQNEATHQGRPTGREEGEGRMPNLPDFDLAYMIASQPINGTRGVAREDEIAQRSGEA